MRIVTLVLVGVLGGLLYHPNLASASSFDTWLEAFKREATAKGIGQKTLESAFAGVKPIARIIELDRKQPEFTLTFEQYISRVVSAARIASGRSRFQKHQKLLAEISQKFAVQPRFIVALWGIESDFGRLTGGFSVIAALATLAHDGRRSAYFRGELLNALKILDAGHITIDRMLGSWAAV